VPILANKLEIVLVVPGSGVEHDDRVSIKVVPLARGDREIGRRIAAGNVEQAGVGSSVYDVQVPPPLIGMPGAFFQVEVLSGVFPSGPRIVSPSRTGTRKNSQTILPVFASSANIWPFPSFMSPPAFPTKTRPSDAIGAAGTDSPCFTSAMVVSQIRLPVSKS